MRILLVTTDYLPNVSGIATLSHEQAIGLAGGASHHVMVLTTTAGAETAADSVANGQALSIRRVSSKLPRIARLSGFYTMLSSTVKEFRPDFIWCTNYRGFGLPVMLVAQARGLPYGIYFHGTELVTENRSLLRRAIFRAVATRAAVVCTNSRNSARLLKEYYNVEGNVATPGVHMPPAGDEHSAKQGSHTDYRAEWLQALGRTAEEEVTVFIAACRVSRQKGLHVAIEAIAALDDAEREKLLYVIVGSGPDLAELKGLSSQLGLEKHVHFHGSAQRDEMAVILRSADVYLQPSQPEGDFLESFGISFLEAQSVGLPCIATRWGGIPEAVQDGKTAMLVSPGSVAEVAGAIRRMLADSEWRDEATGHAIQWASENSWRNHSNTIESLIEATKPAPSHD